MKYLAIIITAFLAIFVAACGSAPQNNSQSLIRPVANTDVSGGPKSPAPINALCSLAPLQAVQAVIGGSTTTLESVEQPYAVECVYTNRQNLTQTISINFINSNQIAQADNHWANAKAYFDELSYASTPIEGLGDAAAWDANMERLLILYHDNVIEITSATVDLGNQQVRNEIIDIGKQIIQQIS